MKNGRKVRGVTMVLAQRRYYVYGPQGIVEVVEYPQRGEFWVHIGGEPGEGDGEELLENGMSGYKFQSMDGAALWIRNHLPGAGEGVKHGWG